MKRGGTYKLLMQTLLTCYNIVNALFFLGLSYICHLMRKRGALGVGRGCPDVTHTIRVRFRCENNEVKLKSGQ